MVGRSCERPRWHVGGAVPMAARLPHLSTSDVAEIDAEVSAVLAEIGKD